MGGVGGPLGDPLGRLWDACGTPMGRPWDTHGRGWEGVGDPWEARGRGWEGLGGAARGLGGAGRALGDPKSNQRATKGQSNHSDGSLSSASGPKRARPGIAHILTQD